MGWIYTDKRAEYVDRDTGVTSVIASITCDDVASLPANTQDLTFVLSSDAYIVADGSKYVMNSSGTWVLQPSDNEFQNVYTKTETDALLAPLSNQLDTDTDALADVVDGKGKNILNITDTSTTTTNRVTISYNGDGTYKIDSAGLTASADGYFYLARSAQNPVFPKGYVISGCSGGSSTSYYLSVAGTSVQQYDSAVTLNANVSGSLIFVFKSGQVFDNLIIKPMVCSTEAWSLSQEFAPTLYNPSELFLRKASLAFTPSTIAHLLNCTFSIPDSSRTLRFTVGKLNSTTNYLQIYVNGVDKGYITFDVSRNIDDWGE